MPLPQEAPLSEVLRDARTRWTRTKITAQNVRARSAQGPIAANMVTGLLDNLRTDLAYFEGVATVPGIGPYAEAQYGDGYAIGPDFAAFTTALQAAIDWLLAAIPRLPEDPENPEAPRYLLLQTLDEDGARVDRTFSTAQTAGLRTVLDTLIATVG